jgi:hypothetical protein
MVRTVLIPAALLIALSTCSVEDVLFTDLPQFRIDIVWHQVQQPGFTAEWWVDGPVEGTRYGEFDADGRQTIVFRSHCKERGIPFHMVTVSGRWEGSSEECYDSFVAYCNGTRSYSFAVEEPFGEGCDAPPTGPSP